MVLAFVFGRRTDEVLKALLGKLDHFEIHRYYTDDWQSYRKYLPSDKHVISKRETQWEIESLGCPESQYLPCQEPSFPDETGSDSGQLRDQLSDSPKRVAAQRLFRQLLKLLKARTAHQLPHTRRAARAHAQLPHT